MFGGLSGASIGREHIVGSIDGPPVAHITLEACLNLPVLYKVLDKVRKTCCLVTSGFSRNYPPGSTEKFSLGMGSCRFTCDFGSKGFASRARFILAILCIICNRSVRMFLDLHDLYVTQN